jgi:hypothetical protein
MQSQRPPKSVTLRSLIVPAMVMGIGLIMPIIAWIVGFGLSDRDSAATWAVFDLCFFGGIAAAIGGFIWILVRGFKR